MSNIGHVRYSKGDKAGELKAVWIHDDCGQGTGLAIGDSNTKFEGKYQIKYFDENGTLQAERDLEIINNGNSYKLTWSKNGVVTCVGIGMENSNILSAGYYDL
ncbi:hypothetical protein [Colwellia psychrerythraea]|uniref:Uncharacterized protein n=1 Tax=Colwellia psychrerythraea TaxID=28229 RepID=A0A099KVW5_COLPS|nr:hypothetical protein [Colwellia psychrerythraea]KGJ93997.1 hypothetical protein GAB14E_2552 [Colwellia psychrerythraea]